MARSPCDPPPMRIEPSTGLRTPKLGRPSQVGRQAIVEAAVAVGFEDLSVSAVARHLGVKHSTLYRYFSSKEELIAAAADQVVAAASWPAPRAGWRPYLRAVARTTFLLFEEHPGLAMQIAGMRVSLAALARQSASTASVLVDLGFDAESAVLAQDLVNELVLLYFLAGQRSGDASTPEDAAELRRNNLLGDITASADPPVADAFSRVIAGHPADWLTRKIEVVLDGIAASAPATSTSAGNTHRDG